MFDLNESKIIQLMEELVKGMAQTYTLLKTQFLTSEYKVK